MGGNQPCSWSTTFGLPLVVIDRFLFDLAITTTATLFPRFPISVFPLSASSPSSFTATPLSFIDLTFAFARLTAFPRTRITPIHAHPTASSRQLVPERFPAVLVCRVSCCHLSVIYHNRDDRVSVADPSPTSSTRDRPRISSPFASLSRSHLPSLIFPSSSFLYRCQSVYPPEEKSHCRRFSSFRLPV